MKGKAMFVIKFYLNFLIIVLRLQSLSRFLSSLLEPKQKYYEFCVHVCLLLEKDITQS